MADDNENDILADDVTNTSNELKKSAPLPSYDINRKVLFQQNVNDLSLYEKPNKNYLDNIKHSFAKFSLFRFIFNLVPVLKWLPKYSFKNSIAGDLTAGMTVAVMHIPQGMAYGLLAGVTPSSGLYMAFFPTLTYFVFGTSRHISVGTLSVISLMTLKVVQTHATIGPAITASTDNATLSDASDTYSPIQVVTAVAFMCGLQQILMSVLQLGHLATLLSEPLVNGFTTGAAVHVLVSQLKDLFGIKIPSYKGAFKIIFTVIDCIKNLLDANPYTVGISFSVIVFMVIMNEIVKPKAAKLFKFPVPAELIAVVAGTAASFLLKFDEAYKVKLVGAIPIGLPPPVMPPIKLLWIVAVDAIAISNSQLQCNDINGNDFR
ncbi:hypothetical protein HA402_007240 [Bradysia odoriphaga]|nr:hypothetical protein HA402_007240 [Bradysia odoriphaga]